MKIIVTRNIFIDAFLSSSTRKEQFSYDALDMMFHYLDQCEDENSEFDMVGCCCTWQECTIEYIASQYDVDLSDCLDEDDRKQATENYLQNRTTVIGFVDSTDSFLFAEF